MTTLFHQCFTLKKSPVRHATPVALPLFVALCSGLLALTAVQSARADLVVHLKYDGDALNAGTLGAAHDGTLNGSAAYTNDAALGGTAISITTAGSGFVAHGASPITGATDRTLSIWTKNSTTAAEAQRSFMGFGSGTGAPNGSKNDLDLDASASPTGVGRVEMGLNGGRTAPTYASPGCNSNVWTLVTYTWSATRGVSLNGGRAFVNGALVHTSTTTTPVFNTAADGFFVGKSANVSVAPAQYFNGLLDDAAIWNETLSDNEVLGLYQVGNEAALKYDAGQFNQLRALHTAATGSTVIGSRTWVYATNLTSSGGLQNLAAGYVLVLDTTNRTGVANWSNTPPSFVINPASATNNIGDSVTFFGHALGQGTITYQWLFAGAPIGGATATNFTRNPVQLVHAGNYSLIASNSFGSRTSSVAVLTVATSPVITSQPANVTVIAGQPITLALGVEGTSPLVYQWRKNGTAVGGATTNPYTIASAIYSDAGNWTCVITNTLGSVTSAVAVVTVNDVVKPVIANATNRTVSAATSAGVAVNYSYITATDDKDGSIAVTLTPASGSTFLPGVTVVKASATDSSTNNATSYFTVTVLGTSGSQTNFSDNFNVSGPSDDINFEYAAGRQSGLLAPIPYAELTRNAQYGQFDIVTAVGNGSYPGTLYMNPFSPTPNNTDATLAHEFTESASFAVEVDVNPSVGTGSSDWVGIAVGAAYPHANPDVTVTGFGILFRGNNEISTFIGGVSQPLNNFPATLPAPPFRVRIEVSSSGFGNGSPAICRAFVNGSPLSLSSNSVELIRNAGLENNYIALSGFAANAGSQQHTFDNLLITAMPSIFASHPNLATTVGRSNQTFTVRVPVSLVATSAVSVVISNSNPAAAQMIGEAGGVLTLNYTSGGPSVKTVTVKGVDAGQSVLSLSSSAPVPVGRGAVTVDVESGAYIYNGSFEEPTAPGFPGYGAIPGWTDSLTTSNGVSQNVNVGGAIPNNSDSRHGKNVAFLQSLSSLFAYDGEISATLTNLTPGQKYNISFVANNQQNAQANALLGVKVDGATLLATEVAAVGASDLGYKPIGVTFTAAGNTAVLAISNTTFTASGLLVDNVRVTSAAKWSMSAWTGDADAGVSFTNTYSHAYNLGKATNVSVNGVLFTGVAGANPAVSNTFWLGGFPTVLNNNVQNNLTGDSASLGGDFVFNGATPKITLLGLTPGATYRLKLFGAGFGTTVGTRVATFFDDSEAFTVDENIFGQGNGLIVNYDYTAASTNVVIDGRTVASGTFHLWAFANQLVSAPVAPPVLNITVVTNNTARIAWPSSAVGFNLQASTVVTGTYTNTGASPILEGAERAVYQPISGDKFYRLHKP